MRTRPASIPHHSTRNSRRWQGRLGVSSVLLLLTVVYFWRQLIAGQALYWGDIGLYFLPMQVFLHANLTQGRLPLWNPLILCGTPYVGNPQTWPLYPLAALLPFVSPTQFINLTVALHVWLAGLGTYAFARRSLGVGSMAALLSAVTFMFGGQLVSKEQFPNMVQAAAYLPWVLLCLDTLLRRRRRRDALVLGLVLGLQLLAAHVQMTVLTLYLAAAYGVFVVREQPLRRRTIPSTESAGLFKSNKSLRDSGKANVSLFPLAGLLLLSSTVASGLAAGQILPTLALFRDAARQRLAFSTVNRFYLPPNQLGNFVLPKIHGHPFYGTWAAHGNLWETCDYVGVLSFALALWAIVAAWRIVPNNAARFWSVVFAVGTLMALGGGGGLYHLAYWVLPGFRSFHDPARCLLWACFALSLLAGWGWEQVPLAVTPDDKSDGNRNDGNRNDGVNSFAVWRGRQLAAFADKRIGKIASFLSPRRRRLGRRTPRPINLGEGAYSIVLNGIVLLLTFADLAHFGQTLYPLADPATLSPQSPNVAAVQADPDVAAHQARILAPTGGVWLRFTNYKDYRQSVPDYQSLWADTLTPNLTIPYGLSQAGGYEPVALKTSETVTSRAAHDFDPKATAREHRGAAALAGLLGVKYIALCQVKPPEGSLPGLMAVRRAVTLAPPGHARQAAWVSLCRDTLWQPRAHLEGLAVAVPLTDDGPDRVTLSVTTLAPARLILADTAAAGWHAMVDGHETPIGLSEGCLRVISLPTIGRHQVVFTYTPTPFKVGLYLSLLTVLLLTGAASFAFARNLGQRAGFHPHGVE